ncbi:MAG: hypothetical protein U0793_02395 [Gemmataceae bacterium]
MTRPDKKRGGRIVLTMGLVFIAAQALASFLFDRVWPEVRFPFLHRRLAKLDDLPAQPDIVCLGSSRFGACLLEREMTMALREGTGEKDAFVFNASVPAGDLVASEHVLSCLLERGIRPRLLLIEISPEALNRHNGWLDFHVERQIGWRDVPRFLPELARAGEIEHLCVCRLLPLYAFRKGFWNFLGQSAQRLGGRALGAPSQGAEWSRAIGITPTLSAAEKAEKTRQGLEHAKKCLVDYEPGGLPVRALKRMLADCAGHGIHPVLLLVPVSSAQRALYDERIEAALESELREIHAAFDCPLFDCRSCLADEQFYDNHHASTEGGAAFSAWVMDRVVTPLWPTVPPRR